MTTQGQKNTEPSEKIVPAFGDELRSDGDLEVEARLAMTAVMRLFLRRRNALVGQSPLPTSR
jgi:hypothetical protein